MFSHTASAIVAPNDAVINTHVRPGLSLKRAVAPRKRAKKTRSGTPRFAVDRCPGSGNANESASKMPGLFFTIAFVGPWKTEYASTHGMIAATSTTHETASKSSRNHHARNVAAPSFANDAGASQPRSENATASTAQATTRDPRPRDVPERQQQPHRREDRRHHHEGEHGDVPPHGEVGERPVRSEVRRERRNQHGERDDPPPA